MSDHCHLLLNAEKNGQYLFSEDHKSRKKYVNLIVIGFTGTGVVTFAALVFYLVLGL